MTDVVVLADGYSRLVSEQTMLADGTCSLIKSSDELILVDTLGAWNGDKLVKLINKQGYHLEDLTYVICTHGHSDHIGNLNLFTNNTQRMINSVKNLKSDESDMETGKSKIKMHFVGDCVYNDDRFEFDLFKEQVFQLNQNVQVRQTPGHTLSCVSLLIDNVPNKGKVAIVGDLFENETDLTDENVWIDAGSESVDQQRLNRKFILDNYDYVVPGHGPMFKVKK